METTPAYQYDVFLSFCGVDTRPTFTDHLYEGMKGAGIRVFLDSEDLKYGREIKDVLKGVDESQIYIPIFSRNFASHPWCLREVARMVKHHSKPDEKREIIPIFYDVEPNDVKLRTDLYKTDILKLKGMGYFEPEEVEQWERALEKVGRIMGRVLKEKRHGEQIKLIVEEVLSKLNGKHLYVPPHLVEDHLQIKAIIEKLDVKSDGVRFLWIHGIGGIGKTTLAKVVFKKLSSYFESVSFLNDVRRSSEHGDDGLVTLQGKLLSSVGSSMEARHIKDTGDGMYKIKAVCKTKRVLLILDDLDKEEQLEKLTGKSDWFGSGSRIIITTRNRNIMKTQGESSNKEVLNQTKEVVDYEVHEMKFHQALKLFCRRAFRSDSPIEGYATISKDMVCKVARLPLAVEVLGSFLFLRGGNKKKIWEQTLKKLDQCPLKDVQDALLISYDGLDNVEKEVFLDIACFFANEDRTNPIIMWANCGYYPDLAIDVLLEQSLIKIGDDNKFWMHDQIRDFGRYIILGGYPCKDNPRKYSRVWIQEHVVELLKRKEGNQDVEALSLTSNGCSHNFTPEELVALPSLRFLRVKESDFCGNFENHPSKLRWLSWQTRQMTFHANNFHFSNLVVLDLSDSDIEDGWGGWSQMKMNQLKVLDLTCCIQLKTTPNFSNFTSLEKLILAQCVNLTIIDRSIDKLKLLETLNIKGCKSLGELPPEVGSLQALTEITMPRNFQPLNLPETFGNLKSLLSLVLDEHPGITRLPGSIGGLVKLERLSLCGCVGIKELPPFVGDLMLLELDISRSGIVELPDSIGKLKKLKVIRVSYTKVRKFPHTIAGMKELEELHAKRCSYLTDENLEELKKLSQLRILDLSYTHVSTFPTVLGCLSCLQTLEMSSSHLQEVPGLPLSLTHLHMQTHRFPFIPDLSRLINLDYLELSRLTVSKEEPDPTWKNESPKKQLVHPLPYGLSVLKCRGISLLPPYSNLRNLSVLCVIGYPLSRFSISKDLIHLRELKVSNCKLLMEILGLSHLKNLQRLDLNRLKGLIEIYGLSDLESLMDFRISHCNRIASLPNLSKLDKLQHIELEACPKIRAIKGIEGLESLKLDNHRCIVLERLLDNSRLSWLSRIVPKSQVFLCFSGPDTPYGIVDFLYKNLVHKQIPVFRDDDDLSFGDEIGKERLLALEDSRIYIPFLSKNYASNWWCLRELAHMVNCATNSYVEKRILPIFYDVDIDDVRLKSNLYKGALNQHRREFGNEVEEWETALRKVAGMQGFDLKSKRYGELIEAIVEEVWHELRRKPLPKCFIEDHHQIKAIIEKLDVDSGGVRFIGIHGMVGVGKTALARIVYNKLSPQFDCFGFLHDIGGSCQLSSAVELQKKLLSSFGVSSYTDHINDTKQGMDRIKRVCGTKKVLIVLDDLDDGCQLHYLAGISNWFGSGSRIIITTKYKGILKMVMESFNEEGSIKPCILNYEVHEMELGQALQLFYKHAFRRDSPMEGYDHLAEKIVRRVGMLPLAVAVIGLSLYCEGLVLEQHSNKIELWEDMLEQLDEHPIKEVRDALMISFDRLDYTARRVFLDIACFSINEDNTYLVQMWKACKFQPLRSIQYLQDMSLLQIRDNKFWMHNQLRDLGRHIIQKEYPQGFRRMWIQEDAVKLLEGKEIKGHVQALSLTYTSRSRKLEPEELAALPHQSFLLVNGSNFSGNFKNVLTKLRWPSWQTCQTTFHMKNFHFSELVVLDLSNTDISDDWGGWSQMKMNRLKVLNLTGCRKLRRTPDFSNFRTLEMLILAWCVNLIVIDSSIGELERLRALNIEGCSSLGKLSLEIVFLGKLREVIMPQNYR